MNMKVGRENKKFLKNAGGGKIPRNSESSKTILLQRRRVWGFLSGKGK